jgi:hypothetical protein
LSGNSIQLASPREAEGRLSRLPAIRSPDGEVSCAAPPHGVDDAVEAPQAVLVGERLNLGADRLVGLPLEQHRGIPVDIAKQRAHRERE